jgi:hypothetical protein
MLIRFLMLVAAVATALALAGGAIADSHARSTTVDATIAGTGCGVKGTACGGTCCVLFWNFTGRANVAPMVGSSRFIASYDEGTVPFSDPPASIRDLTLTFVAGNGDQLVLVDHATWLEGDQGPRTTWTVDQSSCTGRFVGATGSGAYELAIGASDDGTFATFDLHVSGTLTFAA